eukprot:TRINITY_DN15978_c0_g1_i1.p1 TRINITY_DN15978_c0_g1~~TRINITY_DN15978_c0_g1_i1.p1  ORF type:complete len:667 (+),score=92.64 TRINITY_DN15978_c0_g1_i1:116-2116(+)
MTAATQHCLKGNSLLKSGDYSGALRCYEAAAGINEGTRQLNMARCYYKLGLWNRAVTALKIVTSNNKDIQASDYTVIMAWCLLRVIEKDNSINDEYPGTPPLDSDLFDFVTHGSPAVALFGDVPSEAERLRLEHAHARATAKALLNQGELSNGIIALQTIPVGHMIHSDWLFLIKAWHALGHHTALIDGLFSALHYDSPTLAATMAAAHVASRYQLGQYRECIRVFETGELRDTSLKVTCKLNTSLKASSEILKHVAYSHLYLQNFRKSAEVLLNGNDQNQCLPSVLIIKSIWGMSTSILGNADIFEDVSPKVKETLAKGMSMKWSIEEREAIDVSDMTDPVLTDDLDPKTRLRFQESATQLGGCLQYNGVEGFTKNVRHHIASGMGILTFVDQLRQDSFKVTDWQQIYHPAVTWRKLADVFDIVEYSSRLTRESYESGFGCQTPIQIGDFVVPKYAAYRKRCFSILKKELPGQYILTDSQIDAIRTAEDGPSLFSVFNYNIQVITRLTDNGDGLVEGTRIVLCSPDEGKTVSLAIRTASTPSRTSKYGSLLLKCFQGWKADPTMKSAFRCYFCFANLQPLTRGSAACALTTLQAMIFSSTGQLVSLPAGLQLDWEAILTPSFEDFYAEVLKWLPDQLFTPTVDINAGLTGTLSVHNALQILLVDE